jgi:hypothetical protein
MSQSYGEGSGGAVPEQPSGTVETAKHEAANVKDTATEEAGHVVETAKTEAKSVAYEAKSQVKDLYHQSTSELKEQAGIQQRRVAEGLQSVGGELRSMADNAEGGVAADLVRQTSQKISSAASWIGDRDPGSLLNEVKSYARRRPGVFIAGAALVGLVAGRLTRALAESGSDDQRVGGATPAGSAPSTGTAVSGAGATANVAVPPAPPAPVGAVPPAHNSAPDGVPGVPEAGSTPVFDQTDAATRGALRGQQP